MRPKLRFPEFNHSWKLVRLNEVALLVNGLTYDPSMICDEGILVLRSSNVQNGILTYADNVFVDVTDYNSVKEGDVLMCVRNGSRSLIGKTAVIDKAAAGLAFGAFMVVIRSKSIENQSFLSQVFQTNIFFRDVHRNLGATINSINNSSLNKFQFCIPPNTTETKKLGSFFELLSYKINLLTQKKEALETYKKGLMQKIFSQELRFKREDGTDYAEWKTFKLSEVLIEHKKRSDGSEQVHSVSVHKGVVNQIEHLGRSFAAKDVSNYNKVLYGDIIYTKSPTGDFPYGIIKQSYVERAIVSPLYCVTSPIDLNIGYLLNWFFESKINVHNYLHPIIQKGAKNTINITNTTFLSRSLTLPSDMAERQKIKNVYSSLNDNLRTLESEILKMTEFKKGLLQQMFV